MGRRFYLFRRGKYYHVQIINPETGLPMTAKSTGKTDRDEATYIAMSWIKNGIPQGRTKTSRKPEEAYSIDELFYRLRNFPLLSEDVSRIITILKDRGLIADAKIENEQQTTLSSFLNDFWNYENSLHVKEKHSHGHTLSRAHVNNMQKLVVRYWTPYFHETYLSDLKLQQLKEFSLYLAGLNKKNQKGEIQKEKLSTQSINHILKAGTVALRWASKNGILQQNPAEGLLKFSGPRKRRGILSDDEVQRLFTVGKWAGNPGNRIGNILAAQTGLRLGEICALRVSDIGEDRLFIRHSWNESEGLKSTKTGEERQIPLLPETRTLLLNHAKQSPHAYGPNSFVFWSIDSSDLPHHGRNISNALNSCLETIGILKTERQSRGITFHSWRHYFTKKMADRLDQRTMKLTGHKTGAVFEVYADHINDDDFNRAAKATADVFGRVLDFSNQERVV